jgi:hypothetical protein
MEVIALGLESTDTRVRSSYATAKAIAVQALGDPASFGAGAAGDRR